MLQGPTLTNRGWGTRKIEGEDAVVALKLRGMDRSDQRSEIQRSEI
jgi:hypothetical protein